MDKNYIIIGTTSINRIELHNDVLPEWINWITQIYNNKNKYEIVWFINIDIIKNLEDTYDSTVENYKKLINNHNITQIFLKNPDDKGNFLQACKRISENIVKYVDDNQINGDHVKILWLEDDWKLNLNLAININDLIDFYSCNLSHINLSFIRNNYIWALAPSIISYNLWKKVHYSAWLKQTENIDPEHCVGLYYIENIEKPGDMYNCTIINKQINEKYLTQNFMNYRNSYYSYHNNINITNDRYIEKDKIITHFNDKIIFIRLTPSCCSDYGRQYMEKKNIEKVKITNKNDEFYVIH